MDSDVVVLVVACVGRGRNIGLMGSVINAWEYVCNKSSDNKLKDNLNV